MADAVVVVESKAKGGSLITAQMAQDYNRDVFALPGRYNDITSEGCNHLIQSQHAQLITRSEDLITAMGWETTTKRPTQTSIAELLYGLTENQKILLDKLREAEDGWHVNQLVMETQLPYNEVAAELMMMELNGIVKGLPGGIWRVAEK
jgi:DNA processing protein